MEPLIGTKVWFAPRGWGGWGWAPVTVEGWLVLLVAVGATFAASAVLDDGAATLLAIGIAALALATCVAKGTSPGGPARRAEYVRHRENART